MRATVARDPAGPREPAAARPGARGGRRAGDHRRAPRAGSPRILEREHVPGAAFAIVSRDGPVWVGGIGVRDRATGAPMDADTVFRVGSLSKSIIALGVMRLVDQGKLDLDRPLREILPDVAIDNPWDDVAPVTLAQCLEHTAGLDDLRFNEIFTDDEQLPVRAALAHQSTVAAGPLAAGHAPRVLQRRLHHRRDGDRGRERRAVRRVPATRDHGPDRDRRRRLPSHGRARVATRDRITSTTIAPRRTGSSRTGRPARCSRRRRSRQARAVLDPARRRAIRRSCRPPGSIGSSAAAPCPTRRLDSDYGFANYGDVSHPVLGRGHDGGMPGFHVDDPLLPGARPRLRDAAELELLVPGLSRHPRSGVRLPDKGTDVPAAAAARDARRPPRRGLLRAGEPA